MAVPWLFAIGFSMCFAALFSKIWRLNQLIKSAKAFRRITIEVKDVMMPFIILLALNVIFLLVWTIAGKLWYLYIQFTNTICSSVFDFCVASFCYFVPTFFFPATVLLLLLDPWLWNRAELGRDSDGTFLSVGQCAASGKTSTAMLALIWLINIIAVAFASVQAYQTRNLSVAYHGSKFVGLSLATILQSFLIGLPLLFLTNTNATARFLVRAILVFAVCMSILCFIFIPKMLRKDDSGQINSRVDSSTTPTAITMSHSTALVNEEIERLKDEVKRLSIAVASK